MKRLFFFISLLLAGMCSWSMFSLEGKTADLGRPSQELTDTIALSSVQSLPATEICTIRHPQIDSILNRWQKSRRFSGSVLVSYQSKLQHAAGYGYAHKGKSPIPNSPNTPFELASVSKMFTAAAVMLLHQQGKLAYDSTVQQYLPEFPYPDITVRHLLNHRSGLCRYMAIAGEHWPEDQFLTPEDVVCLFATYKPDLFFRPGRRFNYINSNYVVLSALVERVSGQRFPEYMWKHIFEPLGMNHSFVRDPRAEYDELVPATGYRRRGRRFRPIPAGPLDGAYGDKGIYSTVADLYQFDRALYQQVLFHDTTLQEAFSPGSPELRTHNYGFGWRMKTWFPDMYYHFGWWGGFRSAFIRDVDQMTTVIILSNQDNLSLTLPPFEVYCALDDVLNE
ncbi:MAG: serine hydrolase domain-containing protein [Bacteroidota bacterium]